LTARVRRLNSADCSFRRQKENESQEGQDLPHESDMDAQVCRTTSNGESDIDSCELETGANTPGSFESTELG
jgi:hypothetical protein